MANITKAQLEQLVMQQAETIARLEEKVDGGSGSSAVEESPKKSQCFTFEEYVEGPVKDALKTGGMAMEIREDVLCIYQRLDVERGKDGKGNVYKTLVNTKYLPRFNPLKYCSTGELVQDPVHDGNARFRGFHPAGIRDGKQIVAEVNVQEWNIPTAKK